MSTMSETKLSQLESLGKAVDRSQVAVVIPTVNAGELFGELSRGLRLQGFPASQILIVDSSSEDGTRELAAAEGYQVLQIDRGDFNHGGTRQLALDSVPWASVVVYLTQDAVLAAADSLDRLLAVFVDESIAAAYGRQLPRPGAGPIEAHARSFNYPAQSSVRDFESRHALGIKATFMSNSFAAYRVSSLKEVGGFPTDVIMAEDAIVAGRLLLAGWKTAYVAEAEVYHSHGYSLAQEFQRYFDTGVYHRQEMWLRKEFGGPGGEGKRFVMSELAYLTPRHLHLVPYALVRTVSKAIGYELGFRKSVLGVGWSRKLSYHKGYWDNLTTVR
jgi:rhamnosyltransferase